jgi:hypothetical protein
VGDKELLQQHKLFRKYWDKAEKGKSLADYKTADALRKKMLTPIAELANGVTSKADKAEVANIYADFADFLFAYFLFQNNSGKPADQTKSDLGHMAEKTIELDADSFPGHYFLAIYSSMNIMSATAGSGSTVHRGRDAAESIVFTAFNLIGKGLVLGATAAGAGITKSTFNKNVRNMIAAFTKKFNGQKPSAIDFLKLAPRMFHIAEFCEDNGYAVYNEIYEAVAEVNVKKLDYSKASKNGITEAKDMATEIHLIADAKV